MDKEYDVLPKINRNDLIKTKKYQGIFLDLFITDEMNNNYREVMPKLNISQQTLLTFVLTDSSMRCGNDGFLTLMYHGYGEYVFEKPYAKIMNTWGAKKISGIIERAKNLYEKHKDRVEKVRTEEELSCLYTEITDFEELGYEYMMVCEEEYIENHINEFAVIIDGINTEINGKRITVKVKKLV